MGANLLGLAMSSQRIETELKDAFEYRAKKLAELMGIQVRLET